MQLAYDIAKTRKHAQGIDVKWHQPADGLHGIDFARRILPLAPSSSQI
jgi:hypothetical protein